MEELLRQAFQLGQQWVQDMNNEEEPINFNEWYASDKVQKQLQLGGVVSSSDTKKYWKCSLCKDTFEEKQAHECLNGFRANGMFLDEVE